jgi:hypothetical protein
MRFIKSKAQVVVSCHLPKESIWEWTKGGRVKHLIAKNALVAERISSIVSETTGSICWAMEILVVAALSLNVDAIRTVEHFAGFSVGIDVAGKTNRGWWGRWTFVGNQVEGTDHAAGPSNDTLHDISVGDREESTSDGVGPYNSCTQPHSARLINAPEIGQDGSHTHQISSKETEETDNSTDTDQDFDRDTITLGKDIRESHDKIVVNMVSEEDTVDDQTQAQTDRKDG